jgi:hypothetical protein
MCVAAHGQRVSLCDFHLDHGRLLVQDLPDLEDYPEDVLAVQRLLVAETRNHVVDELLRHLLSELGAGVACLDHDAVEVQALGGGRRVGDFNGLEKGIFLDNLAADFELRLGQLVAWVLLDDYFPVAQGVGVVEDGGVCDGATVVCLSVSVRPAGAETRTLTLFWSSSMALVASATAKP